MNEATISTATAWEENDTSLFIKWGSVFVPDRELEMQYFCDLLPSQPEEIHIAEIGCGEGSLAKVLLNRFPKAVYHGYDGSPTMLKKTGTALAEFGSRVDLRQFDLAEETWRNFPHPVHAIVSSLVLHHLDGNQKKQCYRDVTKRLEPGGVFLIFDLIMPQSKAGSELAAAAWDQAVQERSMRIAGNMEPYNEFCSTQWNYYRYPDNVDKPSGLYEQLRWLEESGLAEVDVFWLKAGHALFGGRKRRSNPIESRGPDTIFNSGLCRYL